MGMVNAAASYLPAFAVLSALAYGRARREKTALNARWLAGFGMLGLVTSMLESARLSVPANLASAAVAVCAASDLSSGLIYNSVVGATSLGLFTLAVGSGHGAQMMAGAATGFSVPFALHLLTRGRGLGFGDVKLLSLVGGAYGALGTLAVIGCAFVVGAATSLILLGLGRARLGVAMPFAPYIALGTMGVAFAGFGV